MLSEACRLSGEQLTSYLQREDVKLADFERWRMALEDGQVGLCDQAHPQA